MTWVKLDDGFYDHPKVLAAGPAAAWLHVCALGYCCRHLTDGVFSKAVVPQLSSALKQPSKLAAILVENGMWLDEGGNYRIHDFHVYQRSRAKVLADREATTERVAHFRERRRNETRNAVTSEGVTPDVTVPPTRPDPTSTTPYLSEVLSTEQTKKNRRPA